MFSAELWNVSLYVGVLCFTLTGSCRVKEESIRDAENSAAATDVLDESSNAPLDPRIVERMLS